MPNVGDRVQVTIAGPTALPGTATLRPTENITISGTIVGEEATYWIVKLGATFDGRNLIRVLKSSLVPEQFLNVNPTQVQLQ